MKNLYHFLHITSKAKYHTEEIVDKKTTVKLEFDPINNSKEYQIDRI